MDAELRFVPLREINVEIDGLSCHGLWRNLIHHSRQEEMKQLSSTKKGWHSQPPSNTHYLIPFHSANIPLVYGWLSIPSKYNIICILDSLTVTPTHHPNRTRYYLYYEKNVTTMNSSLERENLSSFLFVSCYSHIFTSFSSIHPIIEFLFETTTMKSSLFYLFLPWKDHGLDEISPCQTICIQWKQKHGCHYIFSFVIPIMIDLTLVWYFPIIVQ